MIQAPTSRAWLAALAEQHPLVLAGLVPVFRPAAQREMRDMLIRIALTRHYPGRPRYRAAAALAADLAEPIAPGSARADMVTAILALNGGRPIGWRQILNVADGISYASSTICLQDGRAALQKG